MASGIPHVTAITGKVQENVDFYAGFLGLRLVKQTGGYEDAEQLHLFYGDRLGSPGSVVTFLVWPDGGRGRIGLGQLSEIAFSVPPASIGDWLQRAIAAAVPVTGPAHELGETVLRLRDPDGIIVKLVGVAMPSPAPLPDPAAPTRIRAVTILTGDAAATGAFTRRFGYREALQDGPFTRMLSDRDAIDLRQSAGFVAGGPGTGVFDHIAFRATDAGAVQRMQQELGGQGNPTTIRDRRYFHSLYVREPMGTLFEYATDGPGFTVDEDEADLGETLMIPPDAAARADDLRVKLPQFARPGEERMPMRDLPFVHRFHAPDDADGSVMVLLHGTGGDEADLMPLAHRIAPRATLLGLRGRSDEEGINRWFRRFSVMSYDQDDIHGEANAFAAFVHGAVSGYGLEEGRFAYLGYSNGANLLGAVMRLHPRLIRCAILLRGIEVLEAPPAADLAGARALLLTGARDPYARMAPALEQSLRAGGADLTSKTLDAGHDLVPQDAAEAQAWLAAGG